MKVKVQAEHLLLQMGPETPIKLGMVWWKCLASYFGGVLPFDFHALSQETRNYKGEYAL